MCFCVLPACDQSEQPLQRPVLWFFTRQGQSIPCKHKRDNCLCSKFYVKAVEFHGGSSKAP